MQCVFYFPVKLTVEKLQLRTTATSLAVKWNLDEDIFLSIFNSTLDFETLTSLDNLTTDPKVMYNLIQF